MYMNVHTTYTGQSGEFREEENGFLPKPEEKEIEDVCMYVCYVMLCYVCMLCYVMLCMLCYAMLCYVMLCMYVCYVMLCYVCM